MEKIIYFKVFKQEKLLFDSGAALSDLGFILESGNFVHEYPLG